MFKINYNPDVLSCLANLSNDEVFTPPGLVNDMLDLLPKELWSNPNARFLDPTCKTGVFLREIAKRLIIGLEDQIPDKQVRINHIFSQQLFGIAITELTSLLSRRSLYCSKTANGKYSISEDFTNTQGNIIFERIQHTWVDGKCAYCGANQEVYDRGEGAELHSYQFIHTEEPERIFNMQFDVIVGNPPYQLSDGGHGASAKPIYHKFFEQAKRINPKYISMIMPARWFAGGRVGELSSFRNDMLNDHRIRELHDFQDASDCFPGVEIKGGVVYLLWDRDYSGICKVHTHEGNIISTYSERFLSEEGTSTFIRDSKAIPILRKVQEANESSFSELVSANDPFGFDIRVEGSMKRIKPDFTLKPFNGSAVFYYNGWRHQGLGYINTSSIRRNQAWLNTHKLFVAKAVGIGDSRKDIIKPFIPESNSCCSETYLVIGPFGSKENMINALSYINTKFFHYLVSLKKITQEARRTVYEFVPIQDFNEGWTDEMLYRKYALTQSEIDHIESVIHPNKSSINDGNDE
jgi:site-specific DNA-methyltransferase (adenine-specific)